MNFKEGDRVKVYYNGNLDFTGKVTCVNQYGTYVIEDGFYSAHNDCPFHPMQCRRLVKKRRLFNDLREKTRLDRYERNRQRIEDLEERLTIQEQFTDRELCLANNEIIKIKNDIKTLAKELHDGLFRHSARILENEQSTKCIEENYTNILRLDDKILKQLNERIEKLEKWMK